MDARIPSVLTKCAWRQPMLDTHTCIQPASYMQVCSRCLI